MYPVEILSLWDAFMTNSTRCKNWCHFHLTLWEYSVFPLCMVHEDYSWVYLHVNAFYSCYVVLIIYLRSIGLWCLLWRDRVFVYLFGSAVVERRGSECGRKYYFLEAAPLFISFISISFPPPRGFYSFLRSFPAFSLLPLLLIECFLMILTCSTRLITGA